VTRRTAAGGDLVWIGNWGDDERSGAIRRYLIEPVRRLGLRATIQGVGYPQAARAELASAGIAYGGWLPNYRVPDLFARHAATVHIPRCPYADALPGIPTIRVFEALACGIPLVSSWWDDCEGLFRPGDDYLVVRSAAEMTAALRAVVCDAGCARELALNGLQTITARHTCAHRVAELLSIAAAVQDSTAEKVLSL
jgi:spore maturation protein CgeB